MDTNIQKVLQNKGDNYIFPFFWMHGESEETIREYMHVIHNSNIGAVCVESRPHPDFVGEGWWKDMDIVLNEAVKLGMKVWILDDSHFPTGYANGALKDAGKELCRQSLVYQKLTECSGKIELDISIYQKAANWTPNQIESYQFPEGTMRQFEDDELLGVVAVKVNGRSKEDIVDLTDFIEGDTLITTLPEGDWNIYVLQLTRNRGPHRDYINMMSKESCRVLIDTVYEPHYEHYGDLFGTTIAGFFSDEPEIGNGHLYDTGKRIFELEDQPWSREIQETLQKKWKKDFRKYLPLLWEESFENASKAKARYDFMDTVTKAVQQDFSFQIGDWCRAHGVKYIGHLIEDNNQHTRTGSSLGHFFRGLAGQDMAGIDDIGGQVLPQGEWNAPYGMMGEFRNGEFYHYVLGKLASSMAAIDPLKHGDSMCEIFGNYGWEEGVRLEKYLVDHFLVRGTNHFVPHAFSPKEFPDPDCPPHFYAHGHNPQYRHFGALMQYTNRLCELLQGGKHVAPVAILYNAEAEWTGNYMNLEEIAKPLADRQIEYDFIPSDVFAERERYGTKLGEKLLIGQQEYLILLIPRMQYITESTAVAIKELGEHGCLVWFVNELPEGICDAVGLQTNDELVENVLLSECIANTEVIQVAELVACLDQNYIPELTITPANNRIRYRHYQKETERYLFVNEGIEAYKGTIQIPQQGKCFSYQAWENQLERVEYSGTESGTSISVELEPGKSMFLVFDDSITEDMLCEPLTLGSNSLSWNYDWQRSICTSINYPMFADRKQVSLPDHLEEELPFFSGVVRYEKILWNDENPEKFLLEITDAGEAVELFVNEETLGIQVAAPFRYDVSKRLRKGENYIRIEVATTLEREMSKEPDPIRTYLGIPQKVAVSKSGICGEVKYDMRL